MVQLVGLAERDEDLIDGTADVLVVGHGTPRVERNTRENNPMVHAEALQIGLWISGGHRTGLLQALAEFSCKDEPLERPYSGARPINTGARMSSHFTSPNSRWITTEPRWFIAFELRMRNAFRDALDAVDFPLR